MRGARWKIKTAVRGLLPVVLFAIVGSQTLRAQALGAPRWLTTIAPAFDSLVRDPVVYEMAFDKFAAGVVRPSVTDCAVIYYGFAVQEGFTPDIPGESEMQRAIMADDYETAYALGVRILERAPANLTALYWTLHAATEAGMSWEVRNSLKGRYNSIVQIISMSGDGRTAQGALKVVWPGDMYTYAMIELGLEIGEGYLWDGRWTELEVAPRAGGGTKYRESSIFFETWKGYRE